MQQLTKNIPTCGRCGRKKAYALHLLDRLRKKQIGVVEGVSGKGVFIIVRIVRIVGFRFSASGTASRAYREFLHARGDVSSSRVLGRPVPVHCGLSYRGTEPAPDMKSCSQSYMKRGNKCKKNKQNANSRRSSS